MGRSHAKNLETYKKFYESKLVLSFQQTIFAETTVHRVGYLKKLVDRLGGESFLDVACHTGMMSFPYAGKRIVGFDINPKAVEIAKRFGDYRVGSFEEIKINEKFDWVIAAEIIEHVIDPKALLKFCTEHSKKYVFVTTPNRTGRYGSGNVGDHGGEHLRDYLLEEFRELISKYGDIVDIFNDELIYVTYAKTE
jgi:2-polyprenyl-3-methyl-5-hydroxy-6-metoxy-1,4-benzoquinol methylase